MSKLLNEKLKSLPKDPGVYLMKDSKYQIIYVGKAKNLKNRVRSYFNSKTQTRKTKKLVSLIQDFELILTKTETEALLLERNLIKLHQPKYNALLRDDKSFPLIRIDHKSKWPRVSKVRHRKEDGAMYLGPYVSERQLNQLISTAHKIFPLIRCSDHEFKNARRPCTYYHLKMCLAPCSLDVKSEEYHAVIEDSIRFLKGKNSELLAILQDKMQHASDREAYEQAAMYRDQYLALQKNLEKQAVILHGVESADVLGWYATEDAFAIHIIAVRQENIVDSQSFVWNDTLSEPKEVLVDFLLQYYERRKSADLIYLPFELMSEKELLEELWRQNQTLVDAKHKSKLLFPQKGQKNELLKIAEKNAKHHLEQELANKHTNQITLQMIQEELGLNKLPLQIECIDISNLQGQANVASLVCFKNNKPFKERYRHYTIQSVSNTQNDFASIREVVSRRLKRAVLEDDLPDLLVIDGGKQQLNFAYEALGEFPNLDLEIIALAKSRLLKNADKRSTAKLIYSDERVFKRGQERATILKTGSLVYRLLTQLRDEAHRFAISFHRQKRKKEGFSSVFEQIDGVGPKIKALLLQHFGSLEAIQNASLSQLEQTPGLSKQLAHKIFLSQRNDS